MGDGDHAFIRLLGEYGSLPSVPIFPHRYRLLPTISRVEAFGGMYVRTRPAAPLGLTQRQLP